MGFRARGNGDLAEDSAAGDELRARKHRHGVLKRLVDEGGTEAARMLPDAVAESLTDSGRAVISRLLGGPTFPGDPDLSGFGCELAIAANAFAARWCPLDETNRACVAVVRRTGYSLHRGCPLEAWCCGREVRR